MEKYIIDKILNTARVEDVLGDFLELHSRGPRYVALCPFHDDRHLGNFVVYPKGNCFKCFTCGAKGGVVEFLKKHQHMTFPDAIRWLGKKYHIETDNTDFVYTPPPPPPEPVRLPTLILPQSMVTAREHTADDTLCRWIRTGINWDGAQRARIEHTLKAYHVGRSRAGHTIFWYIDEQGGVRTGKMMKYRADGHRDRESQWNFDWVHSALSRKRNNDASEPWPFPQYFNPDKQEPRITLFGMHLLNRYPTETPVYVVESEKTALLMAIAYGNNVTGVWMACGGLEMLTRERLQPIIDQHRKIVLYPDRDAIEKWRDKAVKMDYERLIIDEQPVTQWWCPECGEKADIADVIVYLLNKRRPATIVDEVKRESEALKDLCEKFELEPA